MSDDTSRFPDEPLEPAKPAPPAEPAKPADPTEPLVEETSAPVAPASEQAAGSVPVVSEQPAVSSPAPAPAPAPAPVLPVSPYAGVAQAPAPVAAQQPTAPYGAPQQPTSPYGAPQQPASPYGASQPQSPYGGYVPPQPYPTAPVPGTPGTGKALAALICGICAILFSGSVIIGIVLGIIAIILASQYVRSFGKDGKATGGKVCGIIGIVFSILALVGYLMLGVLTMVALNEYADSPSYSYSSNSTETPALPGDSDDAAVKAAAEEQFERLNSADQAIVAMVAEKADDSFYDSSDLHLVDVGIDPTEFAQWLLADTNFTVSEDDAYAYSDGTGTAFADASSRIMDNVLIILSDELTSMIDSGMSVADEAELKAKITELMPSVLEQAAAEPQDSYLMLDFTKKGDTWMVDEDSFENALEQMYGLW